MTTNNLNPIGHPFAAHLSTPAPAPSGMSALAKIVIGIAALFFTAFLYVAFSGSSSTRPMPPARSEDELDAKQRAEVERIRRILLEYFEKVVPHQHNAEFQQLAAVFTGSCPITGHDIEAANLLLAKLSSPASAEPSVRVDPSRETNEQRRLLREEQDREYDEAIWIDQERQLEQRLREAQEKSLRERESAMTKALTPLNAEITEATTALDARFKALEPLDNCWRMVSNYVSFNIKLRAEETYATVFKGFEERFIVTVSLDCLIPEDRYREAVARFNAEFPDEGGSFAEKRATLTESYKGYAKALERVHERLAWVRLNAYHDEVGEKFFAAQFSRELLRKVREGEDLPRP